MRNTNLYLKTWARKKCKLKRSKKKVRGTMLLLLVIYLNLIVGDIVAQFNPHFSFSHAGAK